MMKIYRHILTLLLTALLAVGNVTAQTTTGVVVKGNVYGGGNEGAVETDAVVEIKAGTVEKDVYGGGNLAPVSGNVSVTMTGGIVEKDVYGGGALANTNIGNVTGYGTDNETISSTSTNKTTVNLLGGTIKGDAYGGGLGRIGVDEVVGVKYTQEEADAYNTEHHLTSEDDGFVTTESWKVEPVESVTEVKATVFGDITVNLGSENGETATKFNITNYTGEHADVVKSGRVFGCNNLKGSPQGDVTVTVWKTVAGNKTRTAEGKQRLKEGDEGYEPHTYELAAVYGGGNLADYTATGKTAYVRIKTCEVSIENVYGGGNAAKVPRADVLVQGAHEIKEVFGGGNGKDMYTLDNGNTWENNHGADVGSEETPGSTHTLLTGGYVHEAYGGSNKKGTVYGSVFIDMSVGGDCALEVEKLVGAGKDADVNGDLIMVMGCKPDKFIPIVYGGADNANVNGNVELTITSGKFGKVFGGNNQGGYILGHIKLNIEETGDCDVPIEIDELYLGGNEAAYSMYGYYNAGTDQNPDYRPRSLEMTDSENANYQQAISTISGSTVRHEAPYDQPELNVISCTRIGRVFGGGYGSGAALYGNPIVNINMIPGSHSVDITREGVDAAHRLGEIGGKYTNAENKIVDGGVFGGGDGAAVYGNTTVNIGTATTVNLTSIPDDSSTSNIDESLKTVEGAYIVGNVYGGGNEADVTGNTLVNICAINSDDPTTTDVVEYTDVTISGTNFEGVTIKGNVYGGGKGKADNFTCDKAMVGVNNEGEGIPNPGSGENKEKGTKVIIGNGTVEKNVYGGGEVGRVEWNTVVTIGVGEGVDPTSATPTSAPEIKGSVFGAGSGVATHGYSALVRGDCTVTIEGNAKVKGSVYGGGEIATAGRYWVKGITPGKLGKDKEGNDEVVPTYPNELATGLPYKQRSGGICTVTIRGRAEIGPETPSAVAGNVFGGGKGVEPDYHADGEYQSQRWVKDVGLQGFANEAAYLEFLQTLALVTNTFVNIDGENIRVKGSVYGGSENGFVSTHTDVKIKNGFIGTEGTTTFGNVYGGGKGIETFAEAGKVSENTAVAIIGATTYGSVYGGGELGNVKGNTKIEMNGGTVAKNIYGGGKGKDDTFTCEKGMVGVDGDGEGIPNPGSDENYKEKGTKVIIRNGTVNGSVYGGGEVGRVEWNTQVEIGVGTGEGSFAPEIKGSVFGAGKGAATHGYSALVRGDCTVTIDGGAKVKGSVYGGGEIATAGRYWVNGITPGKLGKDEEGNDEVVPTPPTGLAIGLPYKQRSGGICTVTIKGSAEIGPGTPTADAGNVFGAGKGVEPDYHADGENQSQRWVKDVGLQAFDNEAAYLEFLQTLALVTNTKVTIDGAEAKVKGSVYGGSENGFVQTHTDVKILSGVIGTEGTTAYGNVYGGGKGFPGFAEAGKVSGYTKVTIGGGTTHGSVYGGGELGFVKQDVTVEVTAGEVKKDVYGGGALANTNTDNWNATSDTWATDMVNTDGQTTYKTLVNLKGGTVKGDIYGGGLGRLYKAAVEEQAAQGTEGTEGYVPAVAAQAEVTAIEAKVYGDVTVTTTGGKAARVFGCNNLNGAPQGTVAVNINGTDDITGTNYDYAIGNVYGGGNQAVYSYADADHPLTVTMAGGTVNNVFGGGLSADVLGSIAVNVIGGEVINDVYGGGEMANTNTANWNTLGSTIEYVKVDGITTPTFVGKEVAVGASVTGLYTHNSSTNKYTLITDPYAKATTGTIYYELQSGSSVAGYYILDGTNYIPTTSNMAEENTDYYRKQVVGTWATGMNPSTTTGTGDNAVTTYNTVHKTTVDLTGGIVGNVYGGGLGDATHAANVYGDVSVTVNDPSKIGSRPGVVFTQRQESFTIGNTGHTVGVTGRVFGCNNVNGTPTGNVTVHVYSTRNYKNGTYLNYHVPTETETEAYEIQGVYGGGNKAAYLPADGKKTSVIIEGCDETSIKKVYGGGNSAPVPATDVLIKSSYFIGYAFGGGNGGEYVKINNVWQENQGAIVIGTATIACKGGKVGSVFGGSDAKGTCGGVNIDTKAYTETGSCPLIITRLYGAGNEADIVGNVNMILSSCTDNEIEYVHGGSYNANVTGSVTLTITSGVFRNVYGGNDAQGSINGNITVNIEETEQNCNNPIIIQNLVGGGNNAPYPGINRNGDDLSQDNVKRYITVNVKSATRIDNVYGGCFNAEANADCEVNINMRKGIMAGKNVTIPVLYQNIPNISNKESVSSGFIRCDINDEIGTIGNVFGGGNQGKVKGNTTVNIGTADKVNIMSRNAEGKILNKNGEVIIFNSGEMLEQGIEIGYEKKDVEGAHITGNVYGGGELADVTGNTFVNICAQKGAEIMAGSNHTGTYNYTLVDHSGTTGFEDITIAGSVFGGGKGLADTFTCEKAMIGTDGAGVDANYNDNPDYKDGNTNVTIANGTVGTLDANNKLVEGTGNVYGGGEIGRVEKNSTVTIGLGDGVAPGGTATSAPEIKGDVFGAGKGVATHGYSALLRGNPTVTVQGNAKVKGSVYGGGEIGSVARYQVVDGAPVALANNTSGFCNVTVKGYAKIGPDNMQMTKSGGPDFSGNVFGAGKGILPQVYSYENNDRPKRMLAAAQIATISSYSTYSYSGEKHDNIWEAFGRDEDYHKFIETLALSSQTTVTISDHAFVKGSVYGGSENGIVQYDTHVTIEGNCQIGAGANESARYDEADFIDPTTATASDIAAKAAILKECAHWPYGQATEAANKYASYDKFANDYDSKGGSTTGDDGHTFYGNVFGGGSGYFPYAAGKWHWEAGAVRGNTNVNITGGHILTNVYGGNELTNVGKGVSDTGHGKCTITMSNGTVGVPRTLSQIADHPVTCYIFGGGKGDPRVLFNKQTNVNDVEINITGGIIYGSVFGGGEDGHVMRNVTMTIGNTDGSGPTIGTWGTSYVDGNVFGGGRGFSGDAYTAGNVAGSIDLKIKGGTMLGSIYGGGRLGSVGYGLYESTETAGNDKYGEMQEDGYGDYYLKNGEYTRDAISGFKRGHVEIEISGGTIGNTYEYEPVPVNTTAADLTSWKTNNYVPNTSFELVKDADNNDVYRLNHTKGGNVYAGGMGRRMQLDGVTPITAVDWWRLGAVKSTKLTISGDAIIKSNVYGGCEFGEVLGYHTTNEKNWGTEIVITGGTIGTTIGSGTTAYNFGSVYGGGMGEIYVPTSGTNSGVMDKKIGGDVMNNTSVSMSAGTVRANVYGGGELGSVGTVTNDLEEKDESGKYKYKHIYSDATSGSEAENLANAKTFYDFGLGWPYEFIYNSATGLASVNITGSAQVSNYVFGGGKGKIDIRGSQTDNIVTHRYDEALIANVRETQVTIGTTGSPSVRTVYGGGEDGHVYENASVTIHNGTIERSVFGGGKGEGTYKATLWEPKSGATDDVNQHQEKSSAEAVHSWTAGKVYGNTSVTMNDGSVGWFIYGGGNKASVGKGSYAGGSDDYSTTGYGELPPSANQALWTNADYTGSGQSTVTILGGTVGPTSGSSIDDDGIPHGSVFGGCRGIAAKDVGARSPRYRYVPDFFLGYVNKAIVNIGGTSTTNLGAGPTVHGSVYGGGQDGHVRNSTEVRIFKGTIAGQSDAAARSGHVFGAGSGIGTYTENNVAKCSYSSGSVTCTTLIEVYDDATINGNVYGGGAMAAVGPPRTVQPLDEQKTASGTTKSYSCTQVNIKGGTIKGHVFGASRGPSDDFIAWRFADGSYDPTKFATDLWSDVIISGGTIGTATTGGNVYGGGETGQVKCGVTVNITGGEIAKDVYGGGALAHTNTSNWKFDRQANKYVWTDATNTTAKYTTVVNLLGGTIGGDAYGGGLGRREYGTSGQTGYVSSVEALVYGDVKVNLNGVESSEYVESIHETITEPVYGGRQVKDTNRGAVVNRVFGCNNLNGSPQGKVRVHVFATQNAAANQIINTVANGNTPAVTNAKVDNRYDVQAVYGGANLAAYTPMGDATGTATGITTDYKHTEQRSEVIIDGCSRTSIRQVYGGGNAASAPATYVEVNGTYEIDEVFGGGNGADNYTLVEGGNTIWYQNPGANVGYENYTQKGTGTGADSEHAITAVENTNASTKEDRRKNYGYGSGIATTAIKGGKIHNVYGGSNKKGNISTTALSMYESMNDDCPIDVDESYGGSKDAIIDGDIVTRSQCAHGVKEVFGGSKNADVNSDIVLTITNGSSYERVFGGNNTSGAVAGSITVNIEEGGCEPIKIKELYAGGYLAPYSIYGYETNGRGGYATEEIDYGGTIGKLNQCIPLTKEAFADVLVQYNTYKSHSLQVLGFANESEATEEAIAAKVAAYPNDQDIANAAAQLVSINDFFRSYPKKDPRINIISATRIDNIYGGGYRALVVGSPHVNVNMTNGRVEVENKGTESVPVYNDADGNQYTDVSPETTYRATVNDTKIEVQRVEMTSDIESQLPTTDTDDYKVTEGGKTYVYRNGNRFYKVSTVTSAEKYWATLDIGTIGTIYGGGNMADIYGDTYVEIGTGKWLTWNENGDPIWETTDASGNTYTSSQTSAAVTYTQKECNEYNAENVASYIRSTTSFTDKVSDINTALELTGEAAYTAEDVNYTEVAAAYNATLTGFKSTADVKTPAVLYTAEDAEVIAGTKQVGDVKTPAVYYTRAECNDINKELTGYIAIGATLTAKQAVAVNEALETSYAASSVISTEDAAAYNATLNGYRTTADVKTDAVWTWKDASNETVDQPTSVRKAATITGNVFGGGKGQADTFTCEKAMVGVDGDGVAHPDGGTHVTIANGTVGTLDNDGKLVEGTGNVYGGGEIARVEKNTMVTIGVEANDAPVIYGDVFGAGKGVETHGYSALVRGNPSVIIQGKSQVRGSVYGGGEIASVARYKVVNGSPVALANKTSGNCKVIIRGDAEIGPDNMTMTAEEGPDDTGHVFGAGKGALPGVYSYADNAHRPRRMLANNQIKAGMTTVPVENDPNNSWQYFVNDKEYHDFIETLALSSKTDVTIGGNAFVKGSVYGGSLSGIVQYNTHVTIEGDCQIGAGFDKETGKSLAKYADDKFIDPAATEVTSDNALAECASWEYDKTEGAPYDPFATTAGAYDYTGDYSIIPSAQQRESSDKGKPVATDGHTYYGNVFGGGSGVIPYAPGLWHRAAGIVRGNTVVDITGGHILTSVYGGNEHTDVGIYSEDGNGELTVPVSGGLCTVNFGGTATLGVPRTLQQIKDHPVTCYLFGAGKGDQRIFFNTWTNIREAEVNITGGTIYGSVFGGGEDGHVLEDVTVNISDAASIGTTGTSYVDGNVFGAGRGFSGEALTAGSVGGNVEVNISGGTMLGSIYGGGRLASVGIGFNKVNSSQYGQFTDGDSHGNVTVNISGGIIGNANATGEGAEHSGNVFGGSMGRLKSLNDVDYLPLWPQLGQVKNTTVNIWQEDNNMPTVINGSVYGGGELGTVRDNATIVVGKKSKNDTGGTTRPTICHDIFGGGYGSDIDDTTASVSAKDDQNVTHTFIYTPLKWAGCVGQGTEVNIFDGWVKRHVYGGGEMASVGILNYEVEEVSSVTTQDVVVSHDETAGTYTKYKYIVKNDNVDNSFALSWPYQTQYVDGYEGATHITVTGGRLGDEAIESDNGDIYGGGKGIVGDRYDMAFCANVGSTEITINYPEENEATPANYNDKADGKYKYDCVSGAVYGGGENGHVMGNTDVKLINGLIGHSLYGGGSGKEKYEAWLLKWKDISNELLNTYKDKPIDDVPPDYKQEAEIYSITAGKVYGNTNVTMSGGYVVRNIYGGGTLGSVGKGNYTGGANDYSSGGFGETITTDLWNTDNDGNVVTTAWQTPSGTGGNEDFLGSGIATVTITGGTVGYINPSDISKSTKDGLPYGNVFGGCRGEAAPNVPTSLSPRYKYCPEFFMGYVNESRVTIGKTRADFTGDNAEADYAAYKGPVILGSVYGGGQDGHVRRDTHVKVLNGEIGIPYSSSNINTLKAAIKGSDTNITDEDAAAQASDMDNVQWLSRGNVYGSGSGIGTYTDESGKHNSTSSGSVTGHTLVEIEGGTIYRNVYGGGSLSSIGPPPVKVNTTPPYNDPCVYSRNHVTIKSKIGDADSFTAGYGGHVFGASRGTESLGSSYANSQQTRVDIQDGAYIYGNVFGGGDNGAVKGDAEVYIGEEKVETSTTSATPEPDPDPEP